MASNDRQGGFTRSRIKKFAAAALSYCEGQVPLLSSLPQRNRSKGREVIEFGLTEILESAHQGTEHVRVNERYWTEYFTDSAAREIPLPLQTELIRSLTSWIMKSMWQGVSADTAHNLIEITAYAQEYRDRVSSIAAAVYGRQARTAESTPDSRAFQADSLIDGIRNDVGNQHYVVLVLEPLPDDLLVKVMERHREALATRRDDVSVIVVRVPGVQDLSDDVVYAWSDKVAATCRRLVDSPHLFVASLGAGSADSVPTAYAEAVKNHQAASTLVAPPRVVLPKSVALERHLVEDDELAMAVSAPILPLLESPNLVETLRSFIACDLDRTATAKSLQVDRRSLTYRLEKIKSLTGFDPRGARDFQVLANSLVAHDIHGRRRGSGRPARR